MSEAKFPDVKLKLVGEDGNIFSIIGRVSKALRKGGGAPSRSCSRISGKSNVVRKL